MDAVLQNPIFQNKLSELLGQDWYKIGTSINVKQRKLEDIKTDNLNYRTQENKAFQMIQEWFKVDPNPTFEKLAFAILDIPNYALCKEVVNLAGIPTYTFNSNHSGLCVILCNSSFEKSDDRIGANVDVQTLSETFSKLNFKVITEENKSKNQMYNIIRKCGNEKDVNCFVCVISSHGKLETVFGSDEEPLTFEDMQSAINDNDDNLLIGKPKIFFIQACQGENNLEMYNDSSDTRYLRKPDSKPEIVKASGVAKVADYCFSVATTPGHYAWRSKMGTVYFQTLCSIINNLLVTNEQKSLMSILFRLNHKMREHLKVVSTQAGNPSRLEGNLCNIAYNTLCGDVYF